MLALLVAILGFEIAGYVKDPTPVNSTELTKVETAARFIETAGFNNTVHLGIEHMTQAEFPTFQAEAIGDLSIKLLIRITINGGMEIQPDGLFRTVASAEQLAHIASMAIADWVRIPEHIKPGTNGSFGEFESRKYSYDQFAKYNPGTKYWAAERSEVSGWPDK